MTEPAIAPKPSDLDILDEPLRERAWVLRRWVRARYGAAAAADRPVAVAELVSLAVDAACAGDQAAAARCLAEAEACTGTDLARISRRGLTPEEAAARSAANEAAQAAASASPAAVSGSVLRRGARNARNDELEDRRSGEPAVVITAAKAAADSGLRGTVPVPAARPDPCIVATDGSFANRYHGWAYVTSTGYWGLQAARFGAPGDPDANLAVLITELYAIGMALDYVPDPEVVASDSLSAVRRLEGWAAGGRDLPTTDLGLPADRGGRRAARHHARVNLIAASAARHRDLQVVHVHGHQGHLLNEAADILAKMARRWRCGEDTPSGVEEMRARATAVTESFLRSWYSVPR